jgi:hypothetical protein
MMKMNDIRIDWCVSNEPSMSYRRRRLPGCGGNESQPIKTPDL